jgi:hypothetical protein
MTHHHYHGIELPLQTVTEEGGGDDNKNHEWRKLNSSINIRDSEGAKVDIESNLMEAIESMKR